MKKQFFGILTASLLVVQPVVADAFNSVDLGSFEKFERCDGVVLYDQTEMSESYSGHVVFETPDGQVFFERYAAGVPVAYGTYRGDIADLYMRPEVPLDEEDEIYVYRSYFFGTSKHPDWNGASEDLAICQPDSSMMS